MASLHLIARRWRSSFSKTSANCTQTFLGGQPFVPRGNPRGNFRGPRGRGNFGGPGRGGFAPNVRVDGTLPNGQIDPNSFARPRGGGYTGRGGRKLWVPT